MRNYVFFAPTRVGVYTAAVDTGLNAGETVSLVSIVGDSKELVADNLTVGDDGTVTISIDKSTLSATAANQFYIELDGEPVVDVKASVAKEKPSPSGGGASIEYSGFNAPGFQFGFLNGEPDMWQPEGENYITQDGDDYVLMRSGLYTLPSLTVQIEAESSDAGSWVENLVIDGDDENSTVYVNPSLPGDGNPVAYAENSQVVEGMAPLVGFPAGTRFTFTIGGTRPDIVLGENGLFYVSAFLTPIALEQ